MGQPHFFLAYAPRGAGLRCALAYLDSGRDVYGWFAGPREDTSVARLAKFDTHQPNWTLWSPKFERTVLRQLGARWPLEFRLHGDEVLARRAAGPRP